METATCAQCAYFRRHYVIDSQRCTPVNCGHCCYPRLKHRTPGAPACNHFVSAGPPELPNREEVIDFLTKDMLQHILQLELPPTVAGEDAGYDY